MSWINSNIILEGDHVKLVPMTHLHFKDLTALATEKTIWEFLPTDMSNAQKCLQVFENALIEKEKGSQYPFVIVSKKSNKIIGSTRLMEMYPLHKKLEIGWTWLHPNYWATAINLECKLLLLTFCFEELKTIRVQLKTSIENIRSRKAIEKIGGQFEGILRYDMIRDNGTKRNSAYYSIIETEWLVCKELLTKKLVAKHNEQYNQ